MFDPRSRTVRPLLILLAALGASAIASDAQAQTWRNLTSSRQLRGDQPVAVHVEYGAGTLEVNPSSNESLLYRMQMRYDEERATPVAEFDTAARRLRLGIRNQRNQRGFESKGSSAEIALTNRVPLDLHLQFGAGKAEMDITGLRVRRLNLETGASEAVLRIGEVNPIPAEEVQLKSGAADLRITGLGNLRAERYVYQGGVGATTLDFGGDWSRDASASVQMGVGSLILRFPRSLGVRIDRSSFLTSFEMDGFARRDGSYFSDNWDRSTHQLTLDVEAALGSIEVQWIDD